jgi:hypothetical protein
MEILILGVILVAFMAYVSTRIKKSAALAFERETIEFEDFSIIKPEGFLHVVADESSDYDFEAYSKDYGEGDASEFRKATVKIYKSSGQSDNLPSENEKIEKGTAFQTFRKVLKKGEKSFELEISVLNDNRDEYFDKINEMLDSFSVK